MKITILGTGTSQGIPVIGCDCEACISTDSRDKRLRTSVLIQSENAEILIDTSPDLRAQMLTNNVKNIDAVLYTHEHNDHVIGLDDIRPFNFRSKKDMPLYGQKRVLDDIKSRFEYIFSESPYPGSPRAVMHYIKPYDEVEVGDISILSLPVMHGVLPILGYKIGGFAFITDASYLENEAMEMLYGLDYLVINALQRRKHHSHYNIDQALEVIDMLNPGKAFLTHISHTLGMTSAWEKDLPSNVFPAYDNLSFILD